jgi:protein TonB
MGSENEKAGDPGKQRNSYEAAVLDFLDKEIAATSRPVNEWAAQADDVDALVNNLLKESISASDTIEVEKDAGLEDLDRLFSHIFHEHKAAPPADANRVQPAPDSRLCQALQEVAMADEEAVNLHSVEAVSGMAAVQTAAPEQTVPHEEISSTAVPDAAPAPPALETVQDQQDQEPEVVPAQTAEPDRNLIFSIPPPARPTFRLQMALVGGAFMFLLAATGVVYFIGSKSAAPDNSGKPPAATAQAAPVTSAAPAPAQTAALPATELKDAPSSAARSVADPNPAGATNHNNVVNASEPRKESKPATAAPAAAPPKPNSSTPVPVPAAATEKAVAPVVVPPAENPPATPPARAAEVVAPPPAVQVQAPESALASLIPKPAANLADMAVLNRPAVQPSSPAPALPKKATPALVISRVLPVYPDVARRAHITGTVVVDMLIDEKGKVVKATPVSGPAILYAETVNAVLRWQFKPAYLDGTAVSSSSQVSIEFK